MRHWNTNVSKQNLKDDVLSSFLLWDIQTFKAIPWKSNLNQSKSMIEDKGT